MTEDKKAKDDLNKRLLNRGFGDYSHDSECISLANQLEAMENELIKSLNTNKLKINEHISQHLVEIKFIRSKLAICCCNMLIIGYDMIVDYQDFKANPSPN